MDSSCACGLVVGRSVLVLVVDLRDDNDDVDAFIYETAMNDFEGILAVATT